MRVNYQVFACGGRLVSDVKIVSDKVVRFSVATDVGQGEKKKNAFFDCVAFASNFHPKGWEFLGKLKKGTPLGIRGKFYTDSYEKDGKKINRLCLVVDEFSVFYGDDAERSEGSQTNKATVAEKPTTDDEIPF